MEAVSESLAGRILNMSEIGRDVGISPTTAKKWFSVLQASNQVFLLEPYYRSLGKRITKSPKVYFTDTGLVAYLAGFSSGRSLRESLYMGSFWENHVVVQWLRWRERLNPVGVLWFWQDRTKNEVDLLVEADQNQSIKSGPVGSYPVKVIYAKTAGTQQPRP